MDLVAHSGMDAVAYILILYSLAFLLFLYANMLIYLYDRSANAPTLAKPAANGRARSGSRPEEDGQLRDAGEFELEGLMSDDEDEEDAARRKLLKNDDDDFASPTTAGRNGSRA